MLRGSKPGKRGRRSYFAAGSRSMPASTDSLKLRVGGWGLGGRGRRRTSAVVVGGRGLLGRGRRCTKVVLCFGSGASGHPWPHVSVRALRRRVVRAMADRGSVVSASTLGAIGPVVLGLPRPASAARSGRVPSSARVGGRGAGQHGLSRAALQAESSRARRVAPASARPRRARGECRELAASRVDRLPEPVS